MIKKFKLLKLQQLINKKSFEMVVRNQNIGLLSCFLLVDGLIKIFRYNIFIIVILNLHYLLIFKDDHQRKHN